MKRESKTQFALLGILTQCEMSGYEIKKFIEESLGFFWNESFGQIYPTLKALETDRLVSATEIVSQENSKSKIVYKITKQGIVELKKWLEGSTSKSTLRNEFLLKLFFARNIDSKKLMEMINEEETRNLDDLKIFQSIKLNLNEEHKKHPDHRYWIFTLDYGIDCAKMTLKWLSKIKKELQ